MSACRKRLRENRVMLKSHAITVAEELLPEAPMNCSPLDGGERMDAGGLLRIEEQEVGIT